MSTLNSYRGCPIDIQATNSALEIYAKPPLEAKGKIWLQLVTDKETNTIKLIAKDTSKMGVGDKIKHFFGADVYGFKDVAKFLQAKPELLSGNTDATAKLKLAIEHYDGKRWIDSSRIIPKEKKISETAAKAIEQKDETTAPTSTTTTTAAKNSLQLEAGLYLVDINKKSVDSLARIIDTLDIDTLQSFQGEYDRLDAQLSCAVENMKKESDGSEKYTTAINAVTKFQSQVCALKEQINLSSKAEVVAATVAPPHIWTDSTRSLDRVQAELNNIQGRPAYVSFTNPAYDKAYGKGDGQATWKLHISINPQQRDTAWAIVKECVEKTDLKIHGKIQQAMTEDQVKNARLQPAKEIALMVDASDEDADKWTVFLSDLSKKLSEASIQPDKRAINSDKEAAQAKWDAGIQTTTGPSYFNYRTDRYTIVHDNQWKDWTGGYAFKEKGNVAEMAKYPDATKFVKHSYYTKLPEDKRHNPLGLADFLKGITIR